MSDQKTPPAEPRRAPEDEPWIRAFNLWEDDHVASAALDDDSLTNVEKAAWAFEAGWKAAIAAPSPQPSSPSDSEYELRRCTAASVPVAELERLAEKWEEAATAESGLGDSGVLRGRVAGFNDCIADLRALVREHTR